MKTCLLLLTLLLIPLTAHADDAPPAPAPSPTPTATPQLVAALPVTRETFVSLEADAYDPSAVAETQFGLRGRRVEFTQSDGNISVPATYVTKAKPKDVDALLAALNTANFSALAGQYVDDPSHNPKQSAVLTLRDAQGKTHRFEVVNIGGKAPPAFYPAWQAMRTFLEQVVPTSRYTRLNF